MSDQCPKHKAEYDERHSGCYDCRLEIEQAKNKRWNEAYARQQRIDLTARALYAANRSRQAWVFHGCIGDEEDLCYESAVELEAARERQIAKEST